MFKKWFAKILKPKVIVWKCMTMLTDGEMDFMPKFYTVEALDRESAIQAFESMDMHPQQVVRKVELESDFDKMSNEELGIVTHKEMVSLLINECC